MKLFLLESFFFITSLFFLTCGLFLIFKYFRMNLNLKKNLPYLSRRTFSRRVNQKIISDQFNSKSNSLECSVDINMGMDDELMTMELNNEPKNTLGSLQSIPNEDYFIYDLSHFSDVADPADLLCC